MPNNTHSAVYTHTVLDSLYQLVSQGKHLSKESAVSIWKLFAGANAISHAQLTYIRYKWEEKKQTNQFYMQFISAVMRWRHLTRKIQKLPHTISKHLKKYPSITISRGRHSQILRTYNDWLAFDKITDNHTSIWQLPTWGWPRSPFSMHHGDILFQFFDTFQETQSN